MPRVAEIKHRLRLDFQATGKQRREELSRHADDQRYADAIKKLQHLAATVDEIPDAVVIEYGELCDGDDLGLEEASQMRFDKQSYKRTAQYSSATMMVMTRLVTTGSDGSGECTVIVGS